MINFTRARRRQLSARAAAVAAVAAGTALAIPHLGLGGQRPSGGPPNIDYSNATELLSFTTANGLVRLYNEPTTDGRQCIALSLPDLAAASTAQAIQNGGMTCVSAQEAARPLTGVQLYGGMSWLPDPSGSGAALAIEGRAGTGIAKVTLEMPDGVEVPAALSDSSVGHYYISRIMASAIGQLPGPVAVVGYDANGTPVARLDLEAVLEASTPH